MRNKKIFIILILFICSLIVVPGQEASAIPEFTKLSQSDTYVNLSSQQVLVKEQYQFQLISGSQVLRFEFPLLENQSTSVLSKVMLLDNSSDSELFFIAEKKTAENSDYLGNFSYQSFSSATGDRLYIDVYYDFIPNTDYVLAFDFDQSALLKISEQAAFLKYPISMPDFTNTTNKYSIHFELPYEILPDDYHLQAETETWFEDLTKEYDELIYTSNNFQYQPDQYVYISLPSDLFPDLQINQTGLTIEEFFPKTSLEQTEQTTIKDFVSTRWFPIIVLLLNVIILILVFIFLELDGYILFQQTKLDLSIFELSAAHSAYLLKPYHSGNLILVGLIQLVQKNELDLDKTTFIWKYPEREDFSDFSSSEIFLLQWLFEKSKQIDKYPVISAERIYVQTNDEMYAKDYLINYKQYIDLLEVDLSRQGYTSNKKKVLGKKIYTAALIALTVMMFIVFAISRSWTSIFLLVPIIFSLNRIYKARYLTVRGRAKQKQMKLLKSALRSPMNFLEENKKMINPRDLSPLVLPYAMGIDIVEIYLNKLDAGSLSRLGILDLMQEQIDFDSMSENILDDEWILAKTDIIRMYYLFIASIVSAEISAQQDLIKQDRIEVENKD